MAICKKGSAHWQGGLKRGRGTVSTESGALHQNPYGFNTRFAGAAGINPEELIGASHAACFSMALSLMLDEAGFEAKDIATTAVVSLDKMNGGFAITKIELTCRANVPTIDPAQFDYIIKEAKAECPVSRLIKATIILNYQLIN